MNINYIVGDATEPQLNEDEIGIIVHCCNDAGAWGKGFVLALSEKYPEAERSYRNWYTKRGYEDIGDTIFRLGSVTYVQTSNPKIKVCNLIGQHGIYTENGVPPIRYDALRHGFKCIEDTARILTHIDINWSIHMPRIGCGLAGGNWGVVEKIIQEELCDKEVPVTVYDLKKK